MSAQASGSKVAFRGASQGTGGAAATGRYERGALAGEVIDAAVSEVVARAPYLGGVRALLETTPAPGPLLSCDGMRLRFDPEAVLAGLAATCRLPSREVAHVLAHCVLLHVFPAPTTDPRAWSLAADVVAEDVVCELFGEDPGIRGQTQRAIREQMALDLGGPPSMSRLLDALGRGLWENSVAGWSQGFSVDDHGVWFAGDRDAHAGECPGEGQGQGPQKDTTPRHAGPRPGTHAPSHALEGGGGTRADGARLGPSPTRRLERSRERWDELARRAASELRASRPSREAGTLVREIELAPHPTCDLGQFLARFNRLHGTIVPSDADFDPVLYTHGLSLFGNLPLIEPVEEHEEVGVSALVIALDTSASVAGESLRAFCGLAVRLMSATRARSPHAEIRIIQADARVQDETVIRSDADLDRWRRTARLTGFGGTDFRPTFAHVEELLRLGVVRGVDGLVYLTDGAGVYPARAPAFPVAFVLTDDAAGVPGWALRFRTTHAEIMSLAKRLEEPS